MARQQRQFPQGKYILRTPRKSQNGQVYAVYLYYYWLGNIEQVHECLAEVLPQTESAHEPLSEELIEPTVEVSDSAEPTKEATDTIETSSEQPDYMPNAVRNISVSRNRGDRIPLMPL